MKRLFFFFLTFFVVQCSHHHVSGPQLTSEHFNSSPRGMVVSNGPFSSRAGQAMIEKGGNAVDAAVAISLCLGVELPEASGIGGGGFMLLSMKGKEKLFYDYRERAPKKATANMYEKAVKDENDSVVGPLAVAIPGLVSGLYKVHQEHGRLSWQEVVQPSIDLATNGFAIPKRLATAIETRKALLLKDPELKETFFDQGNPLREGAIVKNPRLAKTLERIQAEGPKAIYYGDFPKHVVERFAGRGILTAEDFANYKTKMRVPLMGRLGEYVFYSAPPPSSGGLVLVEMFNMLEHSPKAKTEFEKVHMFTELMKLAFLDRAKYMGDEDFVKVPIPMLTSAAYAKTQAERVKPNQLLDVAPKDVTGEKGVHTTHFNVVDRDGNVVSSTQTHNYFFGSSVMVDGVVLNNEMDDFSLAPGKKNVWGLVGSYQNAIRPGQTPLTSMAPTIVEKNGNFVLSVGGRGGAQIISATFLATERILVEGMGPKKAMTQPNFHHQAIPNTLLLEKSIDPKLKTELEKIGYQTEVKDSWTGKVTLIYFDGKNYIGVADPREPGKAAGL